MKKILLLILIFSFYNCQSKAQTQTNKKNMVEKIKKSEKEWKEQLTAQEYHVIRNKGTDRPSNDGYTNHFEKGTYVCRACDNQIFKSNSKFESHCGWPSFDDAIDGTVIYTKDATLGMIRTEITCAKCDGHLGHIFDDGPKETTGKRYCVNTSSIKFVKNEE